MISSFPLLISIPGRHAAPVSGFIDEVDMFDAKEFSLSPKEADIMDPAQR